MGPLAAVGGWRVVVLDVWLFSLRAGDQFALFESVVALAILLRRFEFHMAPAAPAVNMTTVSNLLPQHLLCC